jgi:hypothetical protein
VRLLPDRQLGRLGSHRVRVEGQGFLAAALGINGDPADIGGQFMGHKLALEDGAQGLGLGPLGNVQNQTLACPARSKGKHEPRPLGRAAEMVERDREAAMPPDGRGAASCLHGKAGVPDQRAIGKDRNWPWPSPGQFLGQAVEIGVLEHPPAWIVEICSKVGDA